MELTEVLLVAIAVCAGVVTVYMVVWLKNELLAQRQRALTDLVEAAVSAAQQSLWDVGGSARKDFVRHFLMDYGFSPDDPVVDNKIEAAVLHVRGLWRDG